MVCPSSRSSRAEKAETTFTCSSVMTGFFSSSRLALLITTGWAAETRRDGWVFQSERLFRLSRARSTGPPQDDDLRRPEDHARGQSSHERPKERLRVTTHNEDPIATRRAKPAA